MLKELIIKNIVLIKYLNIEFNKGLSVLTGETGTGYQHKNRDQAFGLAVVILYRKRTEEFLSVEDIEMPVIRPQGLVLEKEGSNSPSLRVKVQMLTFPKSFLFQSKTLLTHLKLFQSKVVACFKILNPTK